MFFVFFVIFMVIGIPIISTAYIYLIHYIPFIYLNFLIAIGCGCLLGYLIRLAAKLGKARSPSVVLVCTLVAVIVMKYVQWCIYIPMVLDNVYGLYDMYGVDITLWGRFVDSFDLFTRPGEVFDWAKSINEVGVWGISSSSSTAASSVVTGAMLLIVWILEFLIMAFGSIIVSRLQPLSPFSEESNGWYVEMGKKIETAIPGDFNAMRVSMENGNFSGLIQLSKAGKTDPVNFLRITFYQPPKPSSSEPYYLNIRLTNVVKKNKKKAQTKTQVLVMRLAIDKQSLDEIMTPAAPVYHGDPGNMQQESH